MFRKFKKFSFSTNITLYLLRKFRHRAGLATITKARNKKNILSVLALRPMDFLSGTSLDFWENDLAPCMPSSYAKGDVEDPPENFEDLNRKAQDLSSSNGSCYSCKDAQLSCLHQA
ncbi:hypothetical protein ACOSQ2_014096 [Xanthoceras sorbifolium]